MRIEVSPRVPKALENVVERFLSTHASVQTRVVEWLVKQDDMTIGALLGIIDDEKLHAELPRRIMSKMRGTRVK